MATEQATQEIEALPESEPRLPGWLTRFASSLASDDDRIASTQWWEWLSYGSLIVIAAVMRLWDLGSRAVHHDESLHSFYSWELFQGKGFAHNPMMHGPFQFEANAAIFFVFGDSDYTSRLLYAALGTVLVALPFFFRKRLGKLGALLVSTMLVFSPAMLYFSRFARNDILMAVWTLGLIISMWRYIDEGKSRYLYFAAACLALAFASKETAYLVTALLGLFLTIYVAPDHWAKIRGKLNIEIGKTSPPSAIGQMISSVWTYFRNDLKLSELNLASAFLFILITLTLPQWSAAISLFQNMPPLGWLNFNLANPEGVHPIGAPSGGGTLIAAIVVLILLGVSIYWGFLWKWSVWWKTAVVFYVIWGLLYSTFFTNIEGIGSGVWQGLGYWIAQQDVARGNQPFYYYFVITPLYEFLPLLFASIAAVYYIRRRETFGLFLVFWAGMTLILYTWASEKMPWLLVNVALPLIVLSGKFLGDILTGIEWRRLIAGGGWLLLAGVPLTLVVAWHLAFFGVGEGANTNPLFAIGLAIILVALIVGGVFVARRIGVQNFAAFAAIPVFLILLGLSIRTGWIASYQNGDVPVEMIVYTQTSPDITGIMKGIREAGTTTGQDYEVPITVDQTSGFTWPWAWYLRDYTDVDFPSYSNGALGESPDTSVVLVHSQNQGEMDGVLRNAYSEAERVRHRWWFPENTYRGLTITKVLNGMVDRQTWRDAMDYFLYRKGVEDRLGSEDAYIYFSPDFPEEFTYP